MGEGENSSCTLWLGTGGNRECPLFKDPEQLRRKFRAWMWPHDFEVSMTQLDPGEWTGGPSNFRNNEKRCVLEAQTRYATVVLDGILGHPRPALHTGPCPCYCMVPDANHNAS